jgi:hypothetical protein
VPKNLAKLFVLGRFEFGGSRQGEQRQTCAGRVVSRDGEAARRRGHGPGQRRGQGRNAWRASGALPVFTIRRPSEDPL